MKHDKLAKELGLSDVYAIATGAMFSSGFFLLPGLAAAETGPSVVLAYLVSGIIVLPTMFSVAELATALPRAGGTYYIIDRSLGPMLGTIGGFGSWLALVLKSAFALIGMGAYIAIFFDVNILYVAVILTILFGVLNVVGAKETTWLQKVLVAALLTIMLFYLIQGVFEIFTLDVFEVTKTQFTPFFTDGVFGFFATVGMVFVSYAGLTKVASIAEEVKNPDRNIPLGMFLAIGTAMVVYVVGVYIMVALLDPEAFRSDMTPVATAGEVFLDWLPEPGGLILVVIAAIAAFASTGNAGIMSASRYPMAMARDKLINKHFATVGKLGTPHWSVLGTVILMLFFLLAFNVAEVAKLASAFQLLLFALLNVAVIVMRESRIPEYDPGFKSPWYPWIQIIGVILSIILIFEMGILSILFTVAVCVASIVWYKYYAQHNTERQGAIFHVHARLGENIDRGLEDEMRTILREKGLRDEDPYEKLVSRAGVMEYESSTSFDTIIQDICEFFAQKMDCTESELKERFTNLEENTAISLAKGVALNHARIDDEVDPELVLVRIKDGYSKYKIDRRDDERSKTEKLYALLFFISSKENTGQHLRILAHVAEMVSSRSFIRRWRGAENKEELREILLRDERFIKFTLIESDNTEKYIGKMVKEIDLPGESLITIIRRDGKIKIPHGTTVLQKSDELSIIGEIQDIDELKKMLKEAKDEGKEEE